jgi:23S rRNA (guanosine2251-2'-O)-methyltransferase
MERRPFTKDMSNVIFGIRAIEEAIKAGKEIEKVLIQKNLQSDISKEIITQLSTLKIPFQKVPLDKLNKVTRKNHQGFIGYLSPISFFSLDGIVDECFVKGKDPLILILDRITDVRNFGAIVRTAECAGVDAIVIPEIGSALISGDAMKTSAGALNHAKICRTSNLFKTIRQLQNSGLSVVASTEKTKDDIYKTNLTGPLAFVMGSEETGISDDILNIANQKCKIPMQGKISSLNVSVSAGIIIYEAIRQRNS